MKQGTELVGSRNPITDLSRDFDLYHPYEGLRTADHQKKSPKINVRYSQHERMCECTLLMKYNQSISQSTE